MIENNILKDKSIAFAIRTVNCYKFLEKEKNETVMSKQLLRCGTSIGANILLISSLKTTKKNWV